MISSPLIEGETLFPSLILLFIAKALFLAIVIYYSVYGFEKNNSANNWAVAIILGVLINFLAPFGIYIMLFIGFFIIRSFLPFVNCKLSLAYLGFEFSYILFRIYIPAPVAVLLDHNDFQQNFHPQKTTLKVIYMRSS